MAAAGPDPAAEGAVAEAPGVAAPRPVNLAEATVGLSQAEAPEMAQEKPAAQGAPAERVEQGVEEVMAQDQEQQERAKLEPLEA
ncbi:MAG: hypothetical protein ACLFWD_06200 [Anaerolineales bacterium]